MPMMARVSRVSGVIAVAAVWSFTASPSGAIVVDLDPAAVKQAVEEGKQMKEVKTLPNRFGADVLKDLCGGGGEGQTKKVGHNRWDGLIAGDSERPERDTEKAEEAIQKTSESKRVRIECDLC